MKTSNLYKILHWYIKLYARFYFKKLEIHGLENIPNEGPIIFAANHQNAFLDAVLIHISQSRPPHFLTRGDIFNKPRANKLLRSLKMRPIFRFRDGISNIKKNKSTFSECHTLLENHDVLGIFPEGNHDLRYFLRPLQKGMARIVFEAECRNNFNLSINIIPVGIQYYGNQSSRSNVLIQFGNALNSKDYRHLFGDEKIYINTLTSNLQMALKPLIIEIDEANYTEIKQNWENCRSENFKSLLEIFKNDQKIIDKIPIQKKSTKSHLINKALLAPIAFYGAINNIVLYLLFQKILKVVVTEHEFLGSIKFIMSLVYFPLGFLVQGFIFSFFYYNWAAIYVLSLPITGIIARDWFNDFITKRRIH